MYEYFVCIHIYVYALFVQLSASEQQRFKEGIAINKSLSALANCVSFFWGGGFLGGVFFPPVAAKRASQSTNPHKYSPIV